MKIAVIGLGKMGMQIVRKLVDEGHEVIAYNRSPATIEEAKTYGATGAPDQAAVAAAFQGEPAIVWLMIPADFVHAEVETFLGLLPSGSMLVDGGNSHFDGSIKRAQLATTKGISYVDVGTSGGVMGLKAGFSLMIGGTQESYTHLEPIFKTMTQPSA